MTQKRITARFSDGTTISRVTDKGYPFAWRAYGADGKGEVQTATGFAMTARQAQAYANTHRNRFPYNPSGTEVVKTVASDPV